MREKKNQSCMEIRNCIMKTNVVIKNKINFAIRFFVIILPKFDCNLYISEDNVYIIYNVLKTIKHMCIRGENQDYK